MGAHYTTYRIIMTANVVKGPHHHHRLPGSTAPRCAEPCQLLLAAAALWEGVAAYLWWLQMQQK